MEADHLHSVGKALDLSWSPCDPSDGLSHYILAGNSIWNIASAYQAVIPKEVSMQLPCTSPSQAPPCGTLWHAWSADGHQLAYVCKDSQVRPS